MKDIWPKNHREKLLASYWYEQGREHKSPSPETVKWSKIFRRISYAVILLAFIMVCLSAIQVYQTSEVISQLSYLELIDVEDGQTAQRQ